MTSCFDVYRVNKSIALDQLKKNVVNLPTSGASGLHTSGRATTGHFLFGLQISSSVNCIEVKSHFMIGIPVLNLSKWVISNMSGRYRTALDYSGSDLLTIVKTKTFSYLQ